MLQRRQVLLGSAAPLSSERVQSPAASARRSFTILADKVDRGLRVFNKIFTERAELLWHSVIMLHTLADDISDFHHKAKIAGITGGTTTAVGGIAAIAGLALAPFTLGTSLVITAVGAGVAAAGGITSASAAISDNVNNTNERKKVRRGALCLTPPVCSADHECLSAFRWRSC